jgi:hypothetical protein
MLREALTVTAILLACPGTQVTRQSNVGWAELNHQTAWVLVGTLARDGTDRWTTALHHRQVGDRPDDAVPRSGDVIEVLDDQFIEFVILGFASTGEERRLESPATVDPSLTRDDVVGPATQGTRLRVEEVAVQRLPSGSRMIWLRVTPG